MNYAAGYVGCSSDQIKIRRFEKEREERQKQLEEFKKKSDTSLANVGTRQFSSSKNSLLELSFSEETTGLVTKEEFTKKRQNLEILDHKKQLQENIGKNKFQKNNWQHEQENAKARLSFFCDDHDENDCQAVIYGNNSRKLLKNEAQTKIGKLRSKVYKNPEVDTSFLPDNIRDQKDEREREEIECRIRIFQNEIKSESFDIIYSYWNGSAHRRKIVVSKGHTVEYFLSAVQKQLAHDFKKMRSTSSASLMYIRDDIIIPHQITFYELIIAGAKSKTVPIFNFYHGEEISTCHNVFKETDETREGKVVEREWYEANRKKFPANRWKRHDLVGARHQL